MHSQINSPDSKNIYLFNTFSLNLFFSQSKLLDVSILFLDLIKLYFLSIYFIPHS